MGLLGSKSVAGGMVERMQGILILYNKIKSKRRVQVIYSGLMIKFNIKIPKRNKFAANRYNLAT